MTELRIDLVDAGWDCMDYVKQLRESGLTQGQDFEFWYVPYRFDAFGGDEDNRHVIFKFRDAATATFYKLKWS